MGDLKLCSRKRASGGLGKPWPAGPVSLRHAGLDRPVVKIVLGLSAFRQSRHSLQIDVFSASCYFVPTQVTEM